MKQIQSTCLLLVLSSIVMMFSKEFVLLISIGFVIAAPIAWIMMSRYLSDFEYKIQLGPGIFLFGFALTLFIAVLTVGYRSFKAAVINPVFAPLMAMDRATVNLASDPSTGFNGYRPSPGSTGCATRCWRRCVPAYARTPGSRGFHSLWPPAHPQGRRGEA